MTARIDPTKCRYHPELIPESIAVTTSASGTSIASYAAFQPYSMAMKYLCVGQRPGTTFRLDMDSGHAVMENLLDTLPQMRPVNVDLICEDSMDLWSVGTAFEALYTYITRITILNVYEKIKYGLILNDDEQALSDQYKIESQYKAGTLPNPSSNFDTFKSVHVVSRQVDVTAGGNTRVGRMINVKKGEKAVLLSISVDSDAVQTTGGGPGVDDTYFTVNRDVRDLAYIKLDCAAMPDIHYDLPVYIPAIDRHEVIIESATGIDNLNVRYSYGVKPISVIEKIRWGLPLSNDESNIATEYNLYDAVDAGILMRS